MNDHMQDASTVGDDDISDSGALRLILAKLEAVDAGFAALVRSEIDAGKDTVVVIRQHGKDHKYRKTVPLTTAEALTVTIGILEAYFVDYPLLVASTLDEMEGAVVSSTTDSPSDDAAAHVIKRDMDGAPLVEIERKVATQVTDSTQEMHRLERVHPAMLEEQRQNLSRLRTLLNLESGLHHG